MASNDIAGAPAQLFTQIEDMADGARDNAAAIGIKQNTEAALRADLGTAQTTQNSYRNELAAKPALVTAQTLADSNGRAFLTAARGALVPVLGSDYSPDWEAAGFPNGSTAVPATVGERQALLQSLQSYLIAHPDYAVDAPRIQFTAARAGLLFTALSNARSAVNAALTNAGNRKIARNAAFKALQKRGRGLVGELEQLLEDDSPLWYAFGLNPPGASATPDAPDTPVLTPGLGGELGVDFADVPRALAYRVWWQRQSAAPETAIALRVEDSDATLEGLPQGVPLLVWVTAVNDAGESVASPKVSVGLS